MWGKMGNMDAKILDLGQSVYTLCSDNPELVQILAELGFADIAKPGMLSTAGRFMTLPKGAALRKMDLNTIKSALEQRGYTIVEGGHV